MIRALNWLFPHRQFYLRSQGSVTFFEFTPLFQATVAAISLYLLGWTAYASVIVLFHGEILVAKDQRYEALSRVTKQTQVLAQGLYDECSEMKCDLGRALQRSGDGWGAASALKRLRAAPLAEQVQYSPNAVYETVASSWDALGSVLRNIRWIATRGQSDEVSDETTLQVFIAALSSLMFLAVVLAWRIFWRSGKLVDPAQLSAPTTVRRSNPNRKT